MLTKEDKVTIIGIFSFILVGSILRFLLTSNRYPLLVVSTIKNALIGLLAYKLLR